MSMFELCDSLIKQKEENEQRIKKLEDALIKIKRTAEGQDEYWIEEIVNKALESK